MNRFHTIGPLAVTLAGLLAVLSVAACSPGTATSGQAASPAASPAKPLVTSTLDGYTTLPQRISWVATRACPRRTSPRSTS